MASTYCKPLFSRLWPVRVASSSSITSAKRVRLKFASSSNTSTCLNPRSRNTWPRSAGRGSWSRSGTDVRSATNSPIRRSSPPHADRPEAPTPPPPSPIAPPNRMETQMTALTVAELGTVTAAEIIDARGAACPGPLLEAKKGMGKVAMGDVVELWSSDPVTKTDISAWSGKVGHEFLGVIEDDGYDRVFIRRGK